MRDLAQVKYGEEAWDNVRKMANIDTPTFSIHQVMIMVLRLTNFKSTWVVGNLTFPCSIRNGGNGENHSVQVYPEQLLGKIAKKAFATLGCSADEFFEVRQSNMFIINVSITNVSYVIQGMGYYFVEFCALYGYGDVLALLGRCPQKLFILVVCDLLVLNEFFMLIESDLLLLSC